jgi:hypothetical protein
MSAHIRRCVRSHKVFFPNMDGQLGMFAETAIVDFHWSFADQGKQTLIFCFCLQQTNGICHLPLIPFFIYVCICVCPCVGGVWVFVCVYIFIFIFIFICWRFKQKTEAPSDFPQFIYCLLICKRKFVICPFVDEETNGRFFVCKQTKRTKRTCPSMFPNRYSQNVFLW